MGTQAARELLIAQFYLPRTIDWDIEIRLNYNRVKVGSEKTRK